MDRSLLYVSRKLVSLEREIAELGTIVTVSRRFNATAGITGGLISAPGYFAQLLEGAQPAIDDLMERIDRDVRHIEVTVLRVDAIDRRALPDWTMAYSGPSSYVARRIMPLLGTGLESDPRRIDSLMRLLMEFATL